MISIITHKLAGQDHDLKFSTRAQARVERKFDASITLVLAGIGSRYGVDALAEIIAASMNEGAGGSVQIVYDAMDEMKGEEAKDLVAKLVMSAFPEDDGDPEGDPAKK